MAKADPARQSRGRKAEAWTENRYKSLYTMLLETIPSSVLLIDKDLKIVSANSNFLLRSHRSEEEAIGRRIEEVFPPPIIEQTELLERIRRPFDNSQRDTPVRGSLISYRVPGLSTRVYYYNVVPFRTEKAIEFVMLLMEDVTEQKRLGEEARKAEAHLASVVESANDILASTDLDGRILTWNSAAERVTGHDIEEVRGLAFGNLCGAEDRKAVHLAFGEARRGKGFEGLEWEVKTKGEAVVPVSWTGSVMRDDSGHVTGIVVVGRDLTEHRKFEAQILLSHKLAALGVLAGGIAHEIRNPLAIASSAAQFLLEGSADASFRRECASKILSAVERASAVIENLLRFARPGARSEMVSLDLVWLVKETLALVANQALIQKVKTIMDAPGEPVHVKGVRSLLQQVLMNLFLNALAAMPAGGKLHVRLREADGEAVLLVADTGVGVAPHDVPKIFDPFYTTRPVGTGTGLGLSICYSLLKEHSGTIDLVDTKSAGTTFRVKLPIHS